MLARALNTSPTALMFPGPYYEMVEVLPGLEVQELRAAQWFSGLLSGPTEHLRLVGPLSPTTASSTAATSGGCGWRVKSGTSKRAEPR